MPVERKCHFCGAQAAFGYGLSGLRKDQQSRGLGMKAISIAGNCGKDAVVRRTQDGDAITGWSAAVEERRGQDKRPLWFDCGIFGKRG